MGYRDELIRRLKEDGDWDRMTTNQRELLAQIDDQLAGSFLTHHDTLASKMTAEELVAVTPEGEMQQTLLRQIAKARVTNILEVFDGRLLSGWSPDHCELTEMGRALARFIATAKDAGFSLQDTSAQLSSLTWGGLSALMMLAKADES